MKRNKKKPKVFDYLYLTLKVDIVLLVLWIVSNFSHCSAVKKILYVIFLEHKSTVKHVRIVIRWAAHCKNWVSLSCIHQILLWHIRLSTSWKVGLNYVNSNIETDKHCLFVVFRSLQTTSNHSSLKFGIWNVSLSIFRSKSHSSSFCSISWSFLKLSNFQLKLVAE